MKESIQNIELEIKHILPDNIRGRSITSNVIPTWQ